MISLFHQALECNRLVGLVNSAEASMNEIQQREDDVKAVLAEVDACIEEINVIINDTIVSNVYYSRSNILFSEYCSE